jgi:Family of unknown function (DUF5675)
VTVTLTRFAYLHECTLGWLVFNSLRLATIERPWITNPSGPGGKRMQSCVPDGSYLLSPHDSEKFPQTYVLSNPTLGVFVNPSDISSNADWGRSAVLIHQGNKVDDVVGCIAVGEAHGIVSGQHWVNASAQALKRLRDVLVRTDTHQLDIVPFVGAKEVAA